MIVKARRPRLLIQLTVLLLPMPVRIFCLNKLLGWSISPGVRIGISLVDADEVRIGPKAQIGHFNVIKGLNRLEMGEEASIGHWNWISAAKSLLDSSDHAGTLRLERHARITLRHYLDCSGGIVVAPFAVIAGVKSTILTHQIDLLANRQTVSSVSIGEASFLGSDVRVVAGSRIPDRCVIAMGAVVAGTLEADNTLYGGVPARPIKAVEGEFFSRTHGFTP